jgi:hypothetical protein
MTDQEEHDRAGTLSVGDMQEWLKDQIRDSAKAHELRIKDATGFVTAYAQGKLTPQEALDRLVQYDRRWGEALLGTTVREGATDSDVLAEIDRARDESFKPQRFRRGVRDVNRVEDTSSDKSR